MYIMKTSKEFAALHLPVNEVVKGLNDYFDGFLLDDVRFHSAEMNHTYCYSPKCCLAAAILWLHEQGVDYYCGMPLPCEEEKEKEIQVKVRNVLSTDISIEPDSLPELTVKMALWDGSFDSVLIDSFCEDLIRYISKYGEDKENDLYEHELELLDLKKKIVLALGISLSDRKLAIDDPSKLHDFSYLIKLIEYQTRSYENTSMLLNKANTRCTELEDRIEKAENQYNTLRTELINTLGANPGITDRQLLCKVSSLYYFRREVQRKLGCRIGCSDADTMAVLLKTIAKAECFDDMDKQYMETTKSLCEIAAIIERLQSTDKKKDA